MNTLTLIKNWILNLFGFRKHSKEVKEYLNEANVRSSIYMAFIIVIIEIWMVIRSTNKYVIPSIKAGNNFFDSFFIYTSLFWLFMAAGLAVGFFAIYFLVGKNGNVLSRAYKKRRKIIPIIFASILIIYSFFIFKEINNFVNWDSTYNRISNLGTILVYITGFILGLSIIAHSIFVIKTDKNSIHLSILVVIIFALMCLVFGVKVGYSDFFSRFDIGTGLPRAKADSYEIKSILCFLTMVIYVACLLIWRPYLSILLLTGIFTAFHALITSDPSNRIFPDGETVNYITFLITLSMVAISIYQQRISEALKAQNLEYNAKYDIITDVHNYRYYVDNLAQRLLNITDGLNNYYYLFINIQNFKTYNDQMGFKLGTEFLIRFAKKIEEIFNEFPCARVSDDHFVAFARKEGIENKIKLLENVLTEDAHGLYLYLKVGAVAPITAVEDINTSVDRARYAAGSIKNLYGKTFAEYDDNMHDIYKKKQYIINHLDEAIVNGYISAYYQPVVWSKDKRLCGVEALARWIDPVYGFLSPGDFISTLEEVRLIHKLDTAIYERVCKDLRRMLDEKKKAVPVSINFSRLDFELMDAVEVFESIVDKYDIPKEYVHVEITESALTGNLYHLQQCLIKLRNDGFSIWLDDFGSGYSSLNVLKDFKFDVLKIDMKFLTNFEQKEASKIILDMVVKLAEKLGMVTITEGVETIEQANFLSTIGCERLQGYLFGKPIPLDTLIDEIIKGKYILSKEII